MIMTCVIYGFILEKVGKKSENQNKTEKKKKKKKKEKKRKEKATHTSKLTSNVSDTIFFTITNLTRYNWSNLTFIMH